MLVRTIDAIYRQEGGRILAGLIRRFRDFQAAEDALQEAYLRAIKTWTSDGLPPNPAAWISRVARNCLLDGLRRQKWTHPDGEAILASLEEAEGAEEDDVDYPHLTDDLLRLIFTCCHPALAQRAQAALALRTICRLSTAEIARAFLEPEKTTAQRLVRAKQKISCARIPYLVPTPDLLPERLPVVLSVIYLVFNEGYGASEHSNLGRPDVAAEAIRLGRLLAALLPMEAETKGLLALMLLNDARRPARESTIGMLVPLEEQDRSLWLSEQIAEGTLLLRVAMEAKQSGPYQIQAAISALHCNALSAAKTDWRQISLLYGALCRVMDTPVVRLNAAVSHAMCGHLSEAIEWIKAIEANGQLQNYHLLPAARADLERRMGNYANASRYYKAAIDCCGNVSERRYLSSRLSTLPPH